MNKYFYRFCKLLLCQWLSVAHADGQPHVFFAEEKSPEIDGVISPGEWPERHVVRLSRAFHEAHAIRLYYAWDTTGLYCAAYVEDERLWADGGGEGSGNEWETYNDDSIEWYFDVDLSRDQHLQDSDRFLALNIGNRENPVNDAGVVRRGSWNGGDGTGGASGISGGGVPEDIVYRVSHQGTVNDDRDVDRGFMMEVRIPWQKLGISAPQGELVIGVNAIVISDDTGGTRDWSDNREIEPPANRFITPVRPDEYLEWFAGQQSSSQSGLSGPVNFAPLHLVARHDTAQPGGVGNLVVNRLKPYSLRIEWTSAGNAGAAGAALGYDIRYATYALNESNINNAPRWSNTLPAKLRGSTINTWIMGLNAGETYWFALRAVDAAGNEGPPSFVGPVTLPTLPEAGVLTPPSVYRGAVRIAPGGRYFMTEDGANFIPVGHHLIMEDTAIRHLYPGQVWTGSILHNFAAESGGRERAVAYLDELADHGVNVMRIFVEDLNLEPTGDGTFNEANGAYWLEYPRGVFNENMRVFFQDLLALCAERGIYLNPVIFDTFNYYRSARPEGWQKTAWGTNHGGPLSDIHAFFLNPEVLEMAKRRWTWFHEIVEASGYSDMIFGYDVLNEWDSWAWTRPDPGDPNQDGLVRANFMRELSAHVRSLAPDRLLFSSSTALDPRGALADFSFHTDAFDALLPHLYFPGNREPWNNPQGYRWTHVFKEQTRAIAWFTLNQAGDKPIMNGEWGPSDGWMPDPANPGYFEDFTEHDDNEMTKVLLFTELCSGAAGPGLRLAGGVRAPNGLHLSNFMLGLFSTISAFTENGSKTPSFSFRNYPAENWRAHTTLLNAPANVKVASSSDGKQGLSYLLVDKNVETGLVIGARLRFESLQTTTAEFRGEFWRAEPHQTEPTFVVPGVLRDGGIEYDVPTFDSDWLFRFTREAESTLFDDALYIGSGWKNDPKMGYFTDVHDPWFFHDAHGFFYPVFNDEDMYMFTMDMDWLYTGKTTYPYVYRFLDGTWLWYLPDSKQPRWFLNLQSGSWEEW